MSAAAVAIPAIPRERPVLFQGSMVRALLAGQKTQTRRVSSQWDRVQVGDRLYVRETWAAVAAMIEEVVRDDPTCVGYRADLTGRYFHVYSGQLDAKHWNWEHVSVPWKSPLHMPKWASRIWLEVTAPVRVEPVQSITEEDALAEGLRETTWPDSDIIDLTARGAFESLWREMHGDESWEANPLVRVISFRVLSTTGRPSR